MSQFPLKPSSAYVKAYYKALQNFHKHGFTAEGNIRSVFSDLLRRSQEVLKSGLGKSLSGENVRILDPFTLDMTAYHPF